LYNISELKDEMSQNNNQIRRFIFGIAISIMIVCMAIAFFYYPRKKLKKETFRKFIFYY
jgi:hypothetical protein